MGIRFEFHNFDRMEANESIEAFYQRKPQANPHQFPVDNAGLGHFNVYTRDQCSHTIAYRRRDFYKISLVIGEGTLHFADRWITVDKPALMFSNPLVPYAWEAASEIQKGYFCLFSADFIQQELRRSILLESPLFRVGGNPVFFLPDSIVVDVSGIFKKMIAAISSQYPHKYDLLRNYLHILIHEAMKLQPAESFSQQGNAATRITNLFLELLGRQFPIESPDEALRLKTANDFAARLSVHTNHLNRAVRQTTGKTTTQHIAERIIQEAKALLTHTDWTIAEIAYGLGFEYTSYFNNFFRKHAGMNPGKIREAMV